MPGRPSAAERYTRWRALSEAGRAAEGIAYLRAAAADLADDNREGAASNWLRQGSRIGKSLRGCS